MNVMVQDLLYSITTPAQRLTAMKKSRIIINTDLDLSDKELLM